MGSSMVASRSRACLRSAFVVAGFISHTVRDLCDMTRRTRSLPRRTVTVERRGVSGTVRRDTNVADVRYGLHFGATIGEGHGCSVLVIAAAGSFARHQATTPSIVVSE